MTTTTALGLSSLIVPTLAAFTGGYLIVTSATDSVIRGRFQVAATGFVASEQRRERSPS